MIHNMCDTFFVNFANEGRLKIMILLKHKPLDVNTITQLLGSEQSAISHNLIKMEHCGIIECKREGKRKIYSINKEVVLPILDIYEKHTKKVCSKRCKDD